MGHRRKPRHLSESERAEIFEKAAALHEALCRPLIDVRCADYAAKTKAHDAVVQLFVDLTGKRPPWTFATNSPPYKPPSQG